MAVNTQANLQLTDGGLFEHLGSKTEFAFLKHVQKLGYFYHKIRNLHLVLKVYMFDSTKTSVPTAERLLSDNNKAGDIICKFTRGAPDIPIPECTHHLDSDGMVTRPMSDVDHREVIIMVTELESKGLCTLLLAFGEIRYDLTNNAFWDDLPDT